jgi:hypothetical protein
MSKRVEFKVVGLTFIDRYPSNLKTIDAFVVEAQTKQLGWSGEAVDERVEAVLIRNAENEFDENAVEVHIPMLGRRSMIGHVPRDLAAKLAPSLDRGDVWKCEVETVLVSAENPEQPGIQIVIERVAQAAA